MNARRYFRIEYFLPSESFDGFSNPEGDDFGAKNCPAITSGGYLKGAHNASPSATSSSIKTAPQRNTLAWRNNNGSSFVAQTAAARQKASMSFLRFCGRRAVRGRAPRNFEVLRREAQTLELPTATLKLPFTTSDLLFRHKSKLNAPWKFSRKLHGSYFDMED